ncbi:MAG TPA: caspase family protein [Thermoanaerobaculia bacterium]|nr:caspase family protein [Thermoanaerobaculia bacterium]
MSAKWTTPVKWDGPTTLFAPIPKENIIEVDLVVVNAAEPVAKALPTIFRRLFPRSKVLPAQDCPTCDVVFVVRVESRGITDNRNNVLGVAVTISMTAVARDGATIASFLGEGFGMSTRNLYWSSRTVARGLGGPALHDAMEQLFAKVADDASLRAFAREKVAERARPSDLETTVTFDDATSFFPNGRLDAGESVRLRFRVQNHGAGPAFATRLRLTATAKAVLLPAETEVGDIPPGGAKEVDLPLSAGIDVETAQQQLRVETLEKRGYGGRPIVVQLATERLKRPELGIADVRLEDRGGLSRGDGDGRPSNGETLAAVILIRNSGAGDAVGAELTISSAPGVEVVESSLKVGAISVNAVKEIRTLLRIPVTFDGPDIGLTLRAVEIRGAAVATADGEFRWMLQTKKPQVEIGFRLFDGNSPQSRGNRDGVANNGETLEVALIPRNRGALAARGVRLALASSVVGLGVKPMNIDIGELPPGVEAAEHRVHVTVPRTLGRDEFVQRLSLHVTIAQMDFPVREQLVEFPFSVQRPELVATVANQLPLVEGKSALFALNIRNDGSLAAEAVKVNVSSDNPAVELLDGSGTPARVLGIDVGSIAAGTAVARMQLRAHIRRNVAAVAALLKVSISQRDFEEVGTQAALTILKEEPALISALPPIVPDLNVHPTATVPATVSFQGYRDGSRVAEETVSLTFEVQSQTLLEMVRLEQNHRAVELPMSVPILSTGTYVWQYELQVHLEYGVNEFEVVVITSEGVRNSRSMTLHREKPRGKVWLAVVGISNYRERSIVDLDFAKSDAVAVHSYYHELGVPNEQVIKLLDEDATLANIKRNLGTELVKQATNPDDTVLIYFAGHGEMEADRSSADSDGYSKYLLPHDADPADLFGSALSMEELSRILQRLRPERVVLIIDSCFSGAAGGRTPFEPNAAARGVITEEFLSRMANAGKGRVILTASGSREVARESRETRHGIFTYFLLEGLRGAADTDHDGRVDVDEIYKFVSQKVSSATRGQQNPMLKSPNLTGRLVLGGHLQ